MVVNLIVTGKNYNPTGGSLGDGRTGRLFLEAKMETVGPNLGK